MTPKERKADLTTKFGSFAQKVADEIANLEVWNNPQTIESKSYWQQIIELFKPPIGNKPPTAMAGADQILTLPVNSVTLDGSMSTDPEGGGLKYYWRKVSGPSATMDWTNKPVTTVTNLKKGIYIFELRVVDQFGAFTADAVMITVNDVIIPPPPPPPPTGDNFFASPTGSGSGTQSSPFRIADFFKVAKPGSILNLMDGKYTGVSQMITPPSGLSGQQGKPITIRAINDGKVEIDGQSSFAPIAFENNNWWILDGFNAHHAGSASQQGDNYSVSVCAIKNSSNNILRRICGWDARDGNTNIFGCHQGNNNLFEDCAGWGIARKIFSNSQHGDFTTFRRCFGIFMGSHAQGPKHVFALSYNSYNALAENCIGTWDGVKMKQNYQLLNYGNQPEHPIQNFTNYTVQQPQGVFSHDGFDAPNPDVANVRIYGSIAYLKANQRFHNSTKKMASMMVYEIKGIDVKDSLAYIEPGSRTDIPIATFSGGQSAINKLNGVTLIGGAEPNISGYNQMGIVRSATCGTIKTGQLITKRYINGVKTNDDLWPWPMNQRIIDAMVHGGYAPVDITKTIFELCGTVTPPPAGDIVAKAKQWLAAAPAQRPALESDLEAYKTNIDDVIKELRPKPTKTQTGEVFNNPIPKYPGHQYHLYIPAHYKPSAPIGLMIWLHGGGSYSEGDIQHLADFEMDDEKQTGRSYPRTETDNSNYILCAPIAPFGTFIPHAQHASRWNVPGADQYLMDVITDVATHYNVDYNRIVIAGFSMGGIGAFHMAIRLNDRVAAVMASAGSWDIGSWKSLSAPLYIVHGVKDAYWNGNGDCRDHKTAIEYARAVKQIMGANCELKEYPGGHSWDGTGAAAWRTFINGQTGWVTDKIRNPYRNNAAALSTWRSYDIGSNFNVTWTEKESPHTSWLTIKETGSGTIPYDQAKDAGTGGCGSQQDFNNWSLNLATVNLKGGKAEATITGSNQVSIITANVNKLSIWLHPSMIDFSKPVMISVNGAAHKSYIIAPSLLKALHSYERRWDWGMIYHAEIDIN